MPCSSPQCLAPASALLFVALCVFVIYLIIVVAVLFGRQHSNI